MYINTNNQIYFGDLIPGDRVATDQERLNYNQDRFVNSKESKKRQVLSEYNKRANLIALQYYPEAERIAFSKKDSSASLWSVMTDTEKNSEISNYLTDVANYVSSTIILLAETDFTGLTTDIQKRTAVNDLVIAIQTNAMLFSKLSGILTKDRKRIFAEIDAFVFQDGIITEDTVNNYIITWSV